MKKITVFYYGEGDAKGATRLANAERAGHDIAITRDASVFDGEIEQCTEVVILPGVPTHARKKIEGAYGGDLIKLRGSSKWYGGEIRTEGHGPDAKTSVVIPEHGVIHAPKADPEQVSAASRPQANLEPALPALDPILGHALGNDPPLHRGRGRGRRV